MRAVRVRYHHEEGSWWAESPDLPRWTAAGNTFDEVREQVRSGIRHFLGNVDIVEEGVPEETQSRRDPAD